MQITGWEIQAARVTRLGRHTGGGGVFPARRISGLENNRARFLRGHAPQRSNFRINTSLFLRIFLTVQSPWGNCRCHRAPGPETAAGPKSRLRITAPCITTAGRTARSSPVGQDKPRSPSSGASVLVFQGYCPSGSPPGRTFNCRDGTQTCVRLSERTRGSGYQKLRDYITIRVDVFAGNSRLH